MIVLAVQFNAYLGILFRNIAIRWILDNIHVTENNFRDLFYKNNTWN